MARWNSQGVLEYLGRSDQQVKIRGFRIELGEIENLLAQHHLVRECIVVVHDEAAGQKQLVAYVAADREQAPSQEELRAFLSGKLPAYMVPSRFVRLDSLPLTANGKVDRDALPAPEFSSAHVAECEKPRTPVEKALAAGS